MKQITAPVDVSLQRITPYFPVWEGYLPAGGDQPIREDAEAGEE